MKNILVIDDDDVTREFVTHVLDGAGFRVASARGGREGLSLAARLQSDLILSDVLMDDCDGYTILSTLRSAPGTAAVPVILMTDKADTEGFRQGMVLGADDYLVKPISASALLDAVKAQHKKQEVLKRQAEASLTTLRTNLALALPHEFNTPLNGIMGAAQLLKADAATVSPDEITAFAEDILKSGDRLRRVTHNFLIYVQIEITAQDSAAMVALRRASLDNPAEEVEAEARRTAELMERPNDLRYSTDDSVAAAISKGNLAKIVSELIRNAFRFSRAGTPVEVACGSEEGQFVVSVRDRGRGMTGDQVRQIGAYTQFDRDIHAQEGLGLGLSIASRMTELHGGVFQIDSTPGSGTTVTVRLPRPDPQRPTPR